MKFTHQRRKINPSTACLTCVVLILLADSLLASDIYGPGGPGPFGNPQDLYHTNGWAVQDDRRTFNYDFIRTKVSVPVYFRIEDESDNWDVNGLTCVDDDLYACQLPVGDWYRIALIDHLNYTNVVQTNKNGEVSSKRRRYWSIEGVDGPHPLYVNAAGANRVPPEEKDSPGLIVFVNDNDSDEDGRPDNEDYYIRLGDPDLTEITATHLYGMEVGFSYDSSIMTLYENRTKRYPNRTNNNAIATTSKLRNNYYMGYDDQTLYLEGIQPGTNFLRITGPGGFYDQMKVTVVKLEPRLIPDFNHDRIINSTDENKATNNDPFRFWINDDDDSGDIAEDDSDVPGSGSPDHANGQVDGRCDLTDFFPVWLDLHQALSNLPPGGTVQYKLKQANNAVKAIYTDLTRTQAGNYLIAESNAYGSSFNAPANAASVFQITQQGVTLSPDFLNKILADENKGVLLLEGASATTSPLVLEIWSNSKLITQAELPLSISGVEHLYRWVNLRNMTNPGTLDAPNNYPDSLCNSKNFIFVHGYSVDEQSARGWNAEVFKRMYWSGSRARFHAVTWFGNDSQMNIPLLGSLTPDYHVNVIHAFQTAPVLAAYVNGLSGEHIVAAHSLGNMVASAAIQDYGMNAAKYYMVDAAVALEAYDGDPSARSLDMVHADWDGYQDRLYCGNWHTNFPSGDQRRELTWADRFENAVDHAYNFYSSGEETLSTHPHNDAPGLLDVGIFSEVHEYAWALQEKLKGRMWVSWMGGGSTYGGWGFNPAYNTGVYDRSNDVYLIATTPEAAATIPNYILPENPYFRPGSGDIDDLYSTNAATASAFAQSNHVDLLAAFIPALSLPAGANEVTSLNTFGLRNFNMQYINSSFPGYQTGWPEIRSGNSSYGRRWLHSDFKNIAFPYVHSLFEKFTDTGGLDAQ